MMVQRKQIESPCGVLVVASSKRMNHGPRVRRPNDGRAHIFATTLDISQ